MFPSPYLYQYTAIKTTEVLSVQKAVITLKRTVILAQFVPPATVNTLPSLPESISGRAWREGATEDQYTSFSVPGTWLRHNLRQGVWKFGKVCCMKRQNPLSSWFAVTLGKFAEGRFGNLLSECPKFFNYWCFKSLKQVPDVIFPGHNNFLARINCSLIDH